LVDPEKSDKGNKRTDKNERTIVDPHLRQAACEDSLPATSLPLRAQTLPASDEAKARYSLVLDARQLSFMPQPDANRKLQMDFAVCTFDAGGFPLQYMQDDVDQKLTLSEFQAAFKNGFPHVLEFSASGRISQVRLVARDAQSGLLGSVDLPYVPAIPQLHEAKPVEVTYPVADPDADEIASLGTTTALLLPSAGRSMN
jgi:hypothetical protein